MSANALLSRLEKVRQTKPGRWQACCPAHADRGPSLSVRELDDGRVLVHCFAGCNVNAIVSAVGLDMSDLFPEPSGHDGRRREKSPFSAADALRCVGFEALVVAVAGASMLAGQPFTAEDRERLSVAVGRIQQALETVGVRHGR
jgi:hypothetical protein